MIFKVGDKVVHNNSVTIFTVTALGINSDGVDCMKILGGTSPNHWYPLKYFTLFKRPEKKKSGFQKWMRYIDGTV